MVDKGQCFIVMPISTPEDFAAIYRDGKDHFQHVLECLLIPAIEKAGYQPLPPKAKGADLIHAEIIKNLETAAVVLCDVSTLNPNVFFEFGIRTSLNKPICIVKDELTTKVPFDTTIINYYEYNSSIEPWELQKQIDSISSHIIEAVKRSKGTNEMWKYFGFSSEAQPSKSDTDEGDKLDFILRKIDSIGERLESNVEQKSPLKILLESSVGPFVMSRLPKNAIVHSVVPDTITKEVNVTYEGNISNKAIVAISKEVYQHFNMHVRFLNRKTGEIKVYSSGEDNKS